MTDVNYGTLFTIAGIAGLKVINVPGPELAMGGVESTNHSSGGWRTHVADRLRGIKPFEITVEATAAVMDSVVTVWTAGVPVAMVFTEYGLPAWSFNGLLLKLKYAEAKSATPELVTAMLELQPTSTITIPASAADWYTDVAYIYFGEGGLYTTAAHPTTHQMVVWGVIPGLPPFQLTAAQLLDLTFVSVTVGTATVAVTGIITTVASGDTHLTAKITAAATIETVCVVTVP